MIRYMYLCYFSGKISSLIIICQKFVHSVGKETLLTLSPLPGSIILVNQKGNILPENGYSCLIQTALVIHMHN